MIFNLLSRFWRREGLTSSIPCAAAGILAKRKSRKTSNKFEFLPAFPFAEREGFGVNPKSSLYKAVIQSKICEVAFTTGKDSCFFKTGKQISVYDLLADEALGKATFSKVEGYIEYNGEVQKIKDFRNLKNFSMTSNNKSYI